MSGDPHAATTSASLDGLYGILEPFEGFGREGSGDLYDGGASVKME
jgi:hypothetical protein